MQKLLLGDGQTLRRAHNPDLGSFMGENALNVEGERLAYQRCILPEVQVDLVTARHVRSDYQRSEDFVASLVRSGQVGFRDGAAICSDRCRAAHDNPVLVLLFIDAKFGLRSESARACIETQTDGLPVQIGRIGMDHLEIRDLESALDRIEAHDRHRAEGYPQRRDRSGSGRLLDGWGRRLIGRLARFDGAATRGQEGNQGYRCGQECILHGNLHLVEGFIPSYLHVAVICILSVF